MLNTGIRFTHELHFPVIASDCGSDHFARTLSRCTCLRALPTVHSEKLINENMIGTMTKTSGLYSFKSAPVVSKWRRGIFEGADPVLPA